MVFTSRVMYLAVNLLMMPSHVKLKALPPTFVFNLYGLPYKSSSISFSLNFESFLSMSKSFDWPRKFQPQLSTAYSWNRIAPWFSVLDLSRNRSRSTPILRPRPLQFGHMPFGSLKEKTFECPADGLPMWEYNLRSTGYMSVIVPIVEWDPPPSRFWSTTIGRLRFSIASASGWE